MIRIYILQLCILVMLSVQYFITQMISKVTVLVYKTSFSICLFCDKLVRLCLIKGYGYYKRGYKISLPV